MISFAEEAGTHRAPGELVTEMEQMFSTMEGYLRHLILSIDHSNSKWPWPSLKH